jgi:CBS domain-containing protein
MDIVRGRLEENIMRCKDLMKTDISCCSPDESLIECAKKMSDDEVGFMPICQSDHSQGHRVIGVLTDRDIVLRAVTTRGGKDPRQVKCGEVMTKNPISCEPDDDIGEAADLMARNRVSRMCVCDDDEMLRGVISLSDIVQAERGRGAETLRRVSAREGSAHAGAGR